MCYERTILGENSTYRSTTHLNKNPSKQYITTKSSERSFSTLSFQNKNSVNSIGTNTIKGRPTSSKPGTALSTHGQYFSNAYRNNYRTGTSSQKRINKEALKLKDSKLTLAYQDLPYSVNHTLSDIEITKS